MYVCMYVLNDIIWRAFGAAGIPAVKEPSGLDRQDGTRPGGQGGRSLVWDVTVISPLAASTSTEQPQTLGQGNWDNSRTDQLADSQLADKTTRGQDNPHTISKLADKLYY